MTSAAVSESSRVPVAWEGRVLRDPCLVVNGREKKKNIKRIKRRCKALLFPDDFIMTPSVQRETPRLLAAAPHADRNFLTINGKCHQRQMTPCALRSAISSRICQSYVLLWFRIRNSSEGSENCSDVSRKWTIPAPGGWKGPRFRSLLRPFILDRGQDLVVVFTF